jgi:hypothetical protein
MGCLLQEVLLLLLLCTGQRLCRAAVSTALLSRFACQLQACLQNLRAVAPATAAIAADPQREDTAAARAAGAELLLLMLQCRRTPCC